MLCPRCNESGTRVIDSRDLEGGGTIRRRRECEQCAYRFTTYERPEGARLTVIKRDGSRQEFDRAQEGELERRDLEDRRRDERQGEQRHLRPEDADGLGRPELQAGLMRALEKRPVTLARVEQAVDDIESGLRARGEPEVTSKEIGRLATEVLRDIDQLAYIRFASVYHSYEDISTLKREVDRLMKQRTPAEG